ncbi:MAG: hypothetical protein H0T11_03710 [Chthoniobacterales bacterium]|nr:hypothetical protein [Chthoniobacterales bacterium]
METVIGRGLPQDRCAALPGFRSRIAAALKGIRTWPLLQGWEWVLVTFVFSRLVLFAVMYLARLEFGRGQYWHPGGVFSVFFQFDAELWYIEIAREGYTYSPAIPSSMGFYPFFPMLIKAASPLFSDIRVAALFVSHVSFLIGALLLNALINVDYKDQRVNRATMLFLMFSPVSFFFSHAYSESTFLALAAGAFLAALHQRWLIACLCGMCLSATRNIGVVIALPLFIEYLRYNWRAGFSWKPLFHPRVLLFGLVPLGLILFLSYGYWKFGDFFAYFKATAVWGRTLTTPMETIHNAESLPVFLRWSDGGVFAMGALIWLGAIFARIRLSYLVWAAILLTIYICGSSLEAVPRYISVVFPLFLTLGLASVRWPQLSLPLLGGSIALLVLNTILSAAGFWIT